MLKKILAPLLRQPRAFKALWGIELWERLSFYQMKTLLALYLNERLGLTTAQASMAVGLYMAGVYFSPIPLGYLADKKIGYLGAAATGVALMLAGHGAMTVETKAACYLALALIAFGAGMFKPSMQVMLKGCYRDGDPRSGEAQSIFYVGINLGALLGITIGGYLRHKFGWSVAFGAAGCGLAIGALVMLAFRRDLEHLARPSKIQTLTEVPIKDPVYQDVESRMVRASERRRIAAILALTAAATFFWAGSHQDGGALQFYARDVLRAGDYVEMFNNINPALILLVTIPLATWLASRKVSESTQIALGLGASAVAWSALAIGQQTIAWLFVYYVLETMGEILLSPFGNDLVNRLAPLRVRGMMIGVFLASSGAGGYLAGYLGTYWERVPHATFFAMFAVPLAIVAGAFYVMRCEIQALIDGKAKQNAPLGAIKVNHG